MKVDGEIGKGDSFLSDALQVELLTISDYGAMETQCSPEKNSTNSKFTNRIKL